MKLRFDKENPSFLTKFHSKGVRDWPPSLPWNRGTIENDLPPLLATSLPWTKQW